jgi:pimeloyl-ACP methyl ester carboxylesterase
MLLAGSLPDRVVLPGAGHAPFDEQTDAFFAAF